MARVLLGWTKEQLALASDVPLASVYTLERIGSADQAHKERIQKTLEQAGVELIENGVRAGARLKRDGATHV
jgi:hypothetical protein